MAVLDSKAFLARQQAYEAAKGKAAETLRLRVAVERGDLDHSPALAATAHSDRRLGERRSTSHDHGRGASGSSGSCPGNGDGRALATVPEPRPGRSGGGGGARGGGGSGGAAAGLARDRPDPCRDLRPPRYLRKDVAPRPWSAPGSRPPGAGGAAPQPALAHGGGGGRSGGGPSGDGGGGGNGGAVSAHDAWLSNNLKRLLAGTAKQSPHTTHQQLPAGRQPPSVPLEMQPGAMRVVRAAAAEHAAQAQAHLAARKAATEATAAAKATSTTTAHAARRRSGGRSTGNSGGGGGGNAVGARGKALSKTHQSRQQQLRAHGSSAPRGAWGNLTTGTGGSRACARDDDAWSALLV